MLFAIQCLCCYQIFGYDVYPIGTVSIAFWSTRVAEIVQAAQPKPVWIVIQAFGYDDAKTDWVLPTPEETRSMAYVAIMHGVRGLLFYQHGRPENRSYLPRHQDHWRYLQQLGSELQSLSSVFLLPAAPQPVTPDRPTITVALRGSAHPTVDQNLYLIAANTAHQSPAVNRHYPGVPQSNVTISVHGLTAAQAELLGSAGTGTSAAGRTVPVRDGTLVDSFDPYAVHVYKLTSSR